MQDKLYQYLLLLGDNSMIIGHRLSELCGHGPGLETDIALTNISLDFFGQVRNYFQYAAEIKGGETTEDDIAFLRHIHEYRNCLLCEQPNTDFAHVIMRQFLFDSYHLPLLELLQESKDAHIAAVAVKSLKETKYHLRFSSQWVKRLGDGTEISHEKTQTALDYLWPYVTELTDPIELEVEMQQEGIGADLAAVQIRQHARLSSVFAEVGLTIPQTEFYQKGGKRGVHSEKMGYILTELQFMQRAYPNMEW